VIRHICVSSIAIVGIEPIDSTSFKADLLWTDRGAPATIEIPDFGIVDLPQQAIGNKNSRLFFDVIFNLSNASQNKTI
jgi:hypothetical protein